MGELGLEEGEENASELQQSWTTVFNVLLW